MEATIDKLKSYILKLIWNYIEFVCVFFGFTGIFSKNLSENLTRTKNKHFTRKMTKSRGQENESVSSSSLKHLQSIGCLSEKE